MIGSLILFIFALYCLINRNAKGLLIVIIISLTNDLFNLPLGFNLSLHHTISLILFPKVLKYFTKQSTIFKYIISPLVFEIFYLIFLGVLFGYIIPWRSPVDYSRAWNQIAEGRALIQMIRLIADFGIILLIYYLLSTKQVSLDYLIKVFSIIISITVIITFINYFAANRIKLFLFSEIGRDIMGRYTGFNNEPRSLGKTCSITALFLILFSGWQYKDKGIMGIVFSFIGIIISFSASAYIITITWISIILLYKRNIRYLFISLPILLLVLFFLNDNSFFNNNTKRKLEMVLSITDNTKKIDNERVDREEPEIFTHFEVFDRAALNFLYRNPFYCVIGTGPNLISIPASPYLTKKAYAIYGKKIDSVPHSLIVNILARSGIIGILLWLIFYRRFIRSFDSSIKDQRTFFVSLFIVNLLVYSTLFYFFIGVLLFSINSRIRIKNKIS